MAKKADIYGLGRRKSAVAQVLLTDDAEVRTVNGDQLSDYFATVAMQNLAIRPLEAASQDDVYGLRIKVRGGGKHAQAEAVSLGIARALVAIDEGYKKQLRANGLLTRDSRAKERKKPGLKRARRAPQFSKR